MGYYSDPTASAAVGGINREFSRMEKKAKRLCRLWKEGKISDEKLEQFYKDAENPLSTKQPY